MKTILILLLVLAVVILLFFAYSIFHTESENDDNMELLFPPKDEGDGK